MIAGGGTGGHLFPGIAVAEEVMARDPDSQVVFVGTERGIEARVLPELGWRLELIEVSGLKTVGALRAALGLLRIPKALWQARRLIRRHRPHVVLGVGGYASGPLVLAARLMGVPTAVLEQNSIPGLANKILGRVVRAVFLAFDETRRFFPAKKVVMSGNPIRREIVAALTSPAPTPAPSPASRERVPDRGAPPADSAEPGQDARDDVSDTPPPPAGEGQGGGARAARVFIFGGSQGAVRLNEIVADALVLLGERGVRAHIVHQTGSAGLEDAERRYRAGGIDADCRAFITDMAAEYRKADLIIARSGATTVAELGVVGLPALLVPYPYAADNHQEINARELVEAGAARMFRQAELTPERLADELAGLLADPAALERMGSAMKALGRPRAAATIADWGEEQARATSS